MITFIKTEQTYALRNEILRPGLPIESCYFDTDNDPETKHVGYLDNKEIIGALSIFNMPLPERATLKAEMDTWQLRGMAVAQHAQRRGIGKALVEYTIQYLSQFQPTLIWCNARQNAVPFYQNMGFITASDTFTIQGIGEHIILAYKIT